VADPAGLAPVPSAGFGLPAASASLPGNAGTVFDSSAGANFTQLVYGLGNHQSASL
jgi:hypothetical protein